MQVLSFDCGLRNLAAVVVRVLPDFHFPAECRTYAHADETGDELKARAMAHFVRHGWALARGELIDVSEHLGRETRVKAVKKLGLMSKATAIHAVLLSLESRWFPDTGPDIIAVEIQHGANAEMRAVSLAIPVFFMRSMVTSEYVGVVGGQKLKVCDTVGAHEGDGLKYIEDMRADKQSAKAAARKTPLRKRKAAAALQVPDAAEEKEGGDKLDAQAPARKQWFHKQRAWGGGGGGVTGTTKQAAATSRMPPRTKYEDNKGRAMKAMAALMSPRITEDPALIAAAKDPNIADAILQGVWVLWMRVAPRAPPRRKGPKAPAPAQPVPQHAPG